MKNNYRVERAQFGLELIIISHALRSKKSAKMALNASEAWLKRNKKTSTKKAIKFHEQLQAACREFLSE